MTYKSEYLEKFAYFPMLTASKKLIWLQKYFEYVTYYDWPPYVVATKSRYTYNEGLVAMLHKQSNF